MFGARLLENRPEVGAVFSTRCVFTRNVHEYADIICILLNHELAPTIIVFFYHIDCCDHWT